MELRKEKRLRMEILTKEKENQVIIWFGSPSGIPEIKSREYFIVQVGLTLLRSEIRR